MEYHKWKVNKYIQFSTGDDGVPRQNGLKPVSQKKESAVSTLATYYSIYINIS